ncbi:MAG: hypothetical protein HYU84_18145 [Chloroflexi bacterium]|nr:hypothetical protein [Chloroflexota bacterium]
MKRKILAGVLVGLSSIVLLASLAGMVLAWVYNEPLSLKATNRLDEIDAELEQVEITLKNSKLELERTLRIVDSTEEALNKFTLNDPKAFFEDVQSTLDEGLIPELATARERLIAARDMLENLRVTLFGLNLVPFLQINIPDKTLTDLIDSADAMQTQIEDVGALAKQASTFLDDASYLLGGDFGEARESLEYFLFEIDVYQEKVADWRAQVAYLTEFIPVWLDRASFFLTVALLWSAFSQFGLLLHGLSIWYGENPWEVLKRLKKPSSEVLNA